MNKINFFTPVSYSNTSKSTDQTLLEIVDSYFYLGGKKAEVLPPCPEENGEIVHLVDDTSPLFATVLKIASYCTVVLPLIMLAAKAVLRANHDFYISHQGRVSVITPDSRQHPNLVTNRIIQKPHSSGDAEPTPENNDKKDETIIGQESEIKRTNAAIKIQAFYRGYQARLTLEKLKNEKLEKQKSATKSIIQEKNTLITTTKPYSEVLSNNHFTQPVEIFSNYSMRLDFHGGEKQAIQVNNFNDVEVTLKNILEYINCKHSSVEVYFDWPTSDSKVIDRMVSFQKSETAESLQFSISRYANRTIVIRPKPIKTEVLSDGKISRTYQNGITEILNSEENYGTRIFPDGNKEQGKFHEESGKLISGYRIDSKGKIEFVNPEPLAFYKEESNKGEFEIFGFEGELVVLEKTYDENCNRKYLIIDTPVEGILFKASQRPSYGNGRSIKSALSHKGFDKYRSKFIDHVLSADESGIPRLFGFSNAAALDIIEVGSKTGSIDPLKIVDPISGRHLLIQAANWGNSELIAKLIDLFPQAFQTSGQDVITEFLQVGHSQYDAMDLAEIFNQVGGKLDVYHSLWLQVAIGNKPDEDFKKEFNLLSSKQKQVLYDAAFHYNNTFIHEPADIPVTPEQYSINLMWINKNKIPIDQELLFGDGTSLEQREQDFQERFIKPVSKWAKASPGSRINIWVDGEMATSDAIKNSCAALLKSLEGTSHGTIQFRDVRSIEVVSSHLEVFSEKMPVYFRVDLLRAIAADHTLRKKETKFFVYCDIDMKPLTRQELFDNRTVNFLDDYGFVMAKGGCLGFENGFQILSGENEQFMESHRKVIIDLSVEMALKRPSEIKEQQIYDTYPAMITHFLAEDGRYGKLKLAEKSSNNEVSENPTKKLKRFRYDRFGTTAHFRLPFEKGDVKIRDIMPRKPVRLPSSYFG